MISNTIMLPCREHNISLVYSHTNDILFVLTLSRCQYKEKKGKKDQFDHTMWGPHNPSHSSLLSPHSSVFFSQSHHDQASPLPPSLSSLALFLSLLGRLLPPLLRQSPPLPLGYIGRDWIGKGAPGEFEPIQNLIFLSSPPRASRRRRRIGSNAARSVRVTPSPARACSL